MSSLSQTPSGERLHITIFGRRNVGKSSLINALTGQKLAIVSDVAGTTTDPVSKAMEILPLGPVVVTDTAGIDDTGVLGELRVEKTLRVLEKTDLAILVIEAGQSPGEWENRLVDMIKERQIPLVVVENKIDSRPDLFGVAEGNSSSPANVWARTKGFPYVAVSAATRKNIDALKQAMIAAVPQEFGEPTILGDLVSPGDLVVLVVPIDTAAPKGRLILPQVMTLRDVLDHNAYAVVVKEHQLKEALSDLNRKPRIVITDSQAFRKVAADTPEDVWMTSFSILMARYKSDLIELVRGARALRTLKPGDRVLISEGCTHHRQKDDIGTVQIPSLLKEKVGGELVFGFSSGTEFPMDLNSYHVVVHCGGCMLNPREMRFRQRVAREAGVPMTNYGVALAYLHGALDRALEPFPLAKQIWQEEN
jgi:[FeFe] hydrogenase H-cluster maturation GTPase HydF